MIALNLAVSKYVLFLQRFSQTIKSGDLIENLILTPVTGRERADSAQSDDTHPPSGRTETYPPYRCAKGITVYSIGLTNKMT